MPDQDPKIRELEDRLDRLVRTQIDFQKEISLIRGELTRMRSVQPVGQADRKTESFYTPPPRPRPPAETSGQSTVPPKTNTEPSEYQLPHRVEDEPDPILSSATVSGDPFSRFVSAYTENARADLEKFIGENLISKIGIIVLVLGVGIGAKYAIDNNLISPLARIVTGYIFGFGLIGLAIKLKPKYHNFSAVLISGGMAIMYFLTYFAYSSYALIPQLIAFALMAVFTVLTVAAALVYNRQVIAHIGLVGAYAVPFLLSTDSGNYLGLFSYMTVVNAGILAISLKRNWKPLFYTSSGFTWAIFYTWFITRYSVAEHFNLALVFLGVFFGIFYVTKLLQRRLAESERDEKENLISALATGFIFFAFCIAVSDAALEGAASWTFFSYLSIASVAILATSLRIYGREFMYLVVPFAWVIYGTWFVNRYDATQHFALAATFASLFFAIFYFSILWHRLAEDNFTLIEHTSLILTNAFVFYGFGYSIMDSQDSLRDYLGAFTAANAALHFVVSTVVSRLKPQAIDVSHVLVILILTFAAIAVPVQFDGNVVTIVWATEAAVLFWFGRTRGVRLFEYLSFAVMLLATGSMFMDWAMSYLDRTSGIGPMSPIVNGDFVAAAVFVAAFGFIYITNRDDRFEPAIPVELVRPVGYVIAAVGTFALYNMFRVEIGNYFHAVALEPIPRETQTDPGLYEDLQQFNGIWQINYSLFFLIAMAAANLRKLRSEILAYVNTTLGVMALVIFATVSMFLFFELRVSYMSMDFEPVFTGRWMYVAVRYISYLFAAGLLYGLYRYSRDELLMEQVAPALSVGFEGVAYSFVFIAASCELVNLMGQFHIPDATKLGLSILWGVYALALIVIGIARDKKHLRVAAIVLLAVTLAKLFLYDIADLDTIPKTILFVTLGITLLVVSFLYNKYKDLIFKKDVVVEE